LKAWVEATRGEEVSPGVANVFSEVRARSILGDLAAARRPLLDSVDFVEELPEVLQALCALAENEGAGGLGGVDSLYSLVSDASWPDPFDEREDLLARLAFLRWDLSRKSERYAEAREWRKRCTRHVFAQDHIRDFLASSESDRSEELNRRFLGDGPTVLAYWESLDSERNNQVRKVARQAASLSHWLEAFGIDAGLPEELVHFLTASSLCTAMATQNHTGCWNGWDDLMSQARRHAGLSQGTAELLALFDHLEAIRLCQTYQLQQAEALGESLIPRFEELRNFEQAARVRFLLGRLAKDQGQDQKALRLFEQVRLSATESGDLTLLCLANCQCAQLLNSLGQPNESLRLVAAARAIAARSGSPWSEADVLGTEAELRRDSGDFVGALAGYSAAMDRYEQLGMLGIAAYLRVILAETLLLANRPSDAVRHVVIALEMMDQRKIVVEGTAALTILREAVRRQQADPAALRQIRDELHRMKEEGRL